MVRHRRKVSLLHPSPRPATVSACGSCCFLAWKIFHVTSSSVLWLTCLPVEVSFKEIHRLSHAGSHSHLLLISYFFIFCGVGSQSRALYMREVLCHWATSAALSCKDFCLSVGLNDMGNIISVVAVIDCFKCLYCDFLVILTMNGVLFRVLLVYLLVCI